MSITHDQDISPRIVNMCAEILDAYPELQNVNIRIRKKELRGSTMRAIPSLVFRPFPTLRYNIDISTTVRDADHMKVADLPDEVLKGWLAHEVGHILDYSHRNFFEMLIYGIRYSTSDEYARRVEHRADELAVHHGFYSSIRTTKLFLVRFDKKSSGYGKKLYNNYMSLEDLEICNREWMTFELFDADGGEKN